MQIFIEKMMWNLWKKKEKSLQFVLLHNFTIVINFLMNDDLGFLFGLMAPNKAAS